VTRFKRYVCIDLLRSVTVYDLGMVIPVLYGITLGGQEIYGVLDDDGNFRQEDPKNVRRQKVLPLAGDLGLELPCNAEIVDDAGETIAIIDVGVLNGRVACLSVKAVAGKELSGQVLRRVPLSKLVREAAKSKVVHIRKGFAVRIVGLQDEDPRPQRRTLDRAFLEQVGQIYREALLTNQAPAQAVNFQLGPTTPENARRWIALARKQGVLGPSLGMGRKGEG
jgi:autonomous glycyl radical cofactor GrcA